MTHDLHVLVVGAGGIGCPAAWALRTAGVRQITLIDPDVIEVSNLPRQILYQPADLGQSKALVAAQRLGGASKGVLGVASRLDDSNAVHLLDGVDIMIDATDGALTKDWLNQLAVRRSVPMIHAAGLKSEARIMPIGTGGRPCLACLFGRLEQDTGRCSDLGVWNGVVGTIGFLAAHHALQVHAGRPHHGYHVFDFATGRSMRLGVRKATDCPICTRAAPVEAYPDAVDCELPAESATAEATERPSVTATLDLRTERCPMNLLRTRGLLDACAVGDVVEVQLGPEGALTVPESVRLLGHTILQTMNMPEGGLRVLVRAEAVASASQQRTPFMPAEVLARFARQLVLEDLGDAGQSRLFRSCVRFDGPCSLTSHAAAVYLVAAGVGTLSLSPRFAESMEAGTLDAIRAIAAGVIEIQSGEACSKVDCLIDLEGVCPSNDDVARVVPTLDGGFSVNPSSQGNPVQRASRTSPCIAMARGALLADCVQRALVAGMVHARTSVSVQDEPLVS